MNYDREYTTEAECKAYLDGLLAGGLVDKLKDEDGLSGYATSHIVPDGKGKFRAVVVINR